MANKKTTRRPKKHKPAIVKYTIHKFSDYQSITESDTTKIFVYVNLVNALKSSIKEDATSIELFQLIDHNSTLSLKREDWKDTLNTALEFFAEKEYYEQAAECRNLISLL